MKKKIYLALVCAALCTALAGCGSSTGADTPVSAEKEVLEQNVESQNTSEESSEEETGEESTVETEESVEETTQGEVSEEETSEENGSEETSSEEGESDTITDEQAVAAIANYCSLGNPDLQSIVDAGEYPTYWEVTSSDENEVVVVFRSYTGALTYYYIDRNTGDTHVTELVPGIFDEEQPTDETLNVRDYLN